MDKFILKSIKIENFKGIKTAKIDFEDEKTVLKAPNHSGKTSIRNAFEWCLCQNVNDFLPKIDNKEIYDLVTSVELVITINGTEYSLKRQSEGKYRISEETGRYEKTTNVNSYWIDNIEFSQTNYVKQLVNLFRVDTVDLLPLLVIKDYFATGNTKFDWRERRKLLLKMGDAESCTKELVSQEQFANIKPYLDKKYATSDIKSSLDKERKAYKTKQERNMILIEQKGLENAEIRKIDFEDLQKQLQNLEKEQKELRNKTLQELESESIKSISEQILKQTKELEKLRSEDAIALANKKKELVELYNQTKTIKLDIDKRVKDLELAKSQVEEIKKHKIDTVCPTCKQELPTELQENAQKIIKTNLKTANNQVKGIENELETLKEKYESILKLNKVIGLNIATRPDAITDECIDYLEELSKKTYLTIELGLQTIHETTTKLINRGHDLKCFDRCVKMLKENNIRVVVHIINGLPYETEDMMIETVKFLNELGVDGIKIHMLHILKNTKLADLYEHEKFHVLTKEEYIDIVIKQLEYLDENVVIHRITGDPDVKDLIEPNWLVKKFCVLNDIDKEMVKRNTYQGIKTK